MISIIKSSSSHNLFQVTPTNFQRSHFEPGQTSEVHTSPRYTTEATTGLPIPTLDALTSSTMYVNVYLQPSDSNMSDFMLLHTILSHIERFEHTLTLWPEMNGQDQCCFSFHIFGNDQLQIRADAIHLVNNWICCLGISTPPYFMAMIFPSER